MASVFINYRRAGSAHWASELFEHLSMRYGRDLIFEDIESLTPGREWEKEIRREIDRCDVFLVLIGPGWLEATDDRGQRRLDDVRDLLRIEIRLALDARCTVIPTLVGGAAMPSKKALPDALRALTTRQAVSLRDDRWNEDVRKLIDDLRDLIRPTRTTVSQQSVRDEAYEMQKRYFELLETDQNPAGALESAQALSRLLDRHLPLFPQDQYLKVCRGYSLKNEAMALRRLGRLAEFGESLGEAERVFRTMRAENPRDADAWNGLGSVEALRGNYDLALEYIDRCLEINPKHEAALRDRETVRSEVEKLQHHAG